MTGAVPDTLPSSNPSSNSHDLLLEMIYELRTPLTSIRGALGLLQAGSFGELSEQGQRMLNIAVNNTERLMRLTAAMEQEPIPPVSVMSAGTMARLRLETDLRSALSRQELQVYYQPIKALITNKILGFEALVRWHHPSLGMITPDQFIPLAEETGLIVPMGEWILQEACRQLKLWQQQFPVEPCLSVSVNLSSQQLASPNLARKIHQVLEETGIDPHNLKLEITESGMMDNATTATALLFQLQKMGIQIYIDDFGTGYSSLSRLYELPINVLKIDRSFVNRMCSDTAKLHIISLITSLAQSLGMEVIAEGIETSEQLSQLKALGCTMGQGYLFSKPVPGELITALLAQSYEST